MIDDAGFEAAQQRAVEDDEFKYDVEWRNKVKLDEQDECVVCGSDEFHGFYRVKWKIIDADNAWAKTDNIVDRTQEFVCSHDCKRKLQVKDAL